MGWSIHELKDAREAIASLLDELDLNAYLFGVEPDDGAWKIKVECAENDEWRTVELSVREGELRDCGRDHTVRQRVLASWRSRLSAAHAVER